MAGLGRKIGGVTPNNQIKNAEAQTSSAVNQQQVTPQQSTKPQAKPQAQHQVQQAVQQAQHTQKQQPVQSPALTAILTQLKNIATTLTQIKNINSGTQKESVKSAGGPLSAQQVELGPTTIANLTRAISSENLDEIKQRLLRIDNTFTTYSSNNSTINEQLAAFSNSISEFTNKLAGSTNIVAGTSSSATEYNAKIDTSNIENAFNNFATRLEEIVGISRENTANINKSVSNSVEGENDEHKKETHDLLFIIKENIIKLNQGINDLQKSYDDVSNVTKKYQAASANHMTFQKAYSITDDVFEHNKHDELIETLNENAAKQIAAAEKVINENNDPVTKLNKALNDLRAARDRQDEVAKTNMGAARNPSNNAFNAIDNWLLNKAQTTTNYLMGGGIVKFVNRKKAEKAEKKATSDIRSAEAEILAETKSESDDAVLETQQDRTALPDREKDEKKDISDIRSTVTEILEAIKSESAEAEILAETKSESDDVVLEMQQDRTALPDREKDDDIREAEILEAIKSESDDAVLETQQDRTALPDREKDEKKDISDIRSTVTEILEAIKSESAEAEILAETKSESDDVVLEMQQDRTALPDRPNSHLAKQDSMTSKEAPTGVMVPSNNALSRAMNNATNAIMLRNSAINNFAESKEGRRSGQTADAMKAQDPLLAKLEAQLVQLTLIRAALVEQTEYQRKAEREAEIRAAFEEGNEDPDTSIQLVPVEKETEKTESQKEEKKSGGGLLGLLMIGLGSLFLGKAGFLGKITDFFSGGGVLKIFGNILSFALKGLWKLITNWLPGGLKLLWKLGRSFT